MSNENNGFDIADLVPGTPTPAPLSVGNSQLPAEIKEVQERDVLTLENPKSLINMLPMHARDAILEVINNPENDELFQAFINGDESKIKEKVKPTRVDNTLRYCLWTEHAFAIDRGDAQINPIRIFGPVCSRQAWSQTIRSKRMFWILMPPVDIMAMNRMAYQKGIERLYDILDLPLVNADGKVNNGLATLQLKIVALLDVRLNGPITHRHEINTKNVHIGVSADQVKKLYEQAMKETAGLVPEPRVEYQEVIEAEEHHPVYIRSEGDRVNKGSGAP